MIAPAHSGMPITLLEFQCELKYKLTSYVNRILYSACMLFYHSAISNGGGGTVTTSGGHESY